MPAGERAAETGDISNPDERPQSHDPRMEDEILKKQSKKKLIDTLTKELESPSVRNGEAKMMIEHAMFVRSVQLEEARKNVYIQ